MYIYQDALTIEHTESSIAQTYNILADEIVGYPQEDVIVRMFALNYIPAVYNGLPMRRFNMHQTAPGTWKATARWELINWNLQFELTGSHQHVTHAKETIASYPATSGGMPPDFKGAINVDKSGPHGCEIYVPSGQWSETYEVPVGDISQNYELAVKDLRKTPVNNAPFRGRAKGEVLIMGMTGQISSVNPLFYTLTWRFAEEANQTGIDVPGISGTIDKEGWQYSWLFYGMDIDDVAIATIHRPLAAYVERVYDYGDFSVLNIGSTRSDAGWQGR